MYEEFSDPNSQNVEVDSQVSRVSTQEGVNSASLNLPSTSSQQDPSQVLVTSSAKNYLPMILSTLFLLGSIFAGVSLVRRAQNLEEKAALDAPCKACEAGVCKEIAKPPSCSKSLNECSTNSDCKKAGGGTPPPAIDCGKVEFSPWGSCPSECKGVVRKVTDDKGSEICEQGASRWICSGKKWQPDYKNPGDCKSSCPWPKTNGKCCPVPPDACSKPGEIICIDDPFASKCVEWDKTCPAGQRYYYKAIDWSSDISEIEARNKCEEKKPTPTRPPSVSFQCLNVKAYDTNWNLLTPEQLRSLKPGDKVRFAVAGSTNSGGFDKARFIINGVPRQEVTQKKPGSDEFYDEYTVPQGVTSFNISAQVHHVSLGWSD